MKKEEKLLRAIGGIDDELIADALASPKKVTRPGWLRWMAAAACLCLLLASPVGAAMGESLHKFMNSEGTLEHMTLDRLPLDALTEEALAAFPDETGLTNYIPKDSLADAEEYLGIDLPDNAVLEAADVDEMDLETAGGEKILSHCILYLSTGDQPEPYCVSAEAAYRVNDISVRVMYRYPTERNPYENGGVGFNQEDYDAEEFTSTGGRKWDLYIADWGDRCYSAQALSQVNGALVWVQLWDVRNIDRATLRDMMIDMMQAYD